MPWKRERVLSTAIVAARMDVTPETVRNWIRAGHLVATRVGEQGRWRILESDFLRFYEQRWGSGAPVDVSYRRG